MTEKYNEIMNKCPHFDGYCKDCSVVFDGAKCDPTTGSAGCAYLGGNPITREEVELGTVFVECSCSMYNEYECKMDVRDYIHWDFKCPYKGT